MTCADHQRTINRLIDHEVKATDCGELFEHLGTCSECRVFYDSLLILEAELEKIQSAVDEKSPMPFEVIAPPRWYSSAMLDRKASGMHHYGKHDRFRAFTVVLITVIVSGLIWTRTLPTQRDGSDDSIRDAVQSDMMIHQR
ncbi:MAG: hypothetical protein NTU47_03100 [Ignavibacteriales bacterium]|nr:hypothetical protein [Ignavibacteriales bacterium]